MKPNLLLKLEGASVVLISVVGFSLAEYSWWIFAALFLLPDLFMVGYLKDTKTGALIYNLGHTYAVVIPIGLLCYVNDFEFGVAACIIWVAHIGFDRFFGFGLKKESGFKNTHLST